MATLAQEPRLLKDYLALEDKLIHLALTDSLELMGLVDRMVHEAYIAGVNREEAGIYLEPDNAETIGQVCVLADSWCKHKGTRP